MGRVLTRQGPQFSSQLPVGLCSVASLSFGLPSLGTHGSLNQHSSLFVTVSSSFSPASLGAFRAKTSPMHLCDPPSPQHGLARHMEGQHPGYVCG